MCAMKDSGVEWIGEIPVGWISEPLRVNASFSKGLAITKADLTQDGVKVISYGQVHSKLNTGTSTKEELFRYVPSKLAVGQASRLFLGDLAFADTSEDRDGLGAAAYIDTSEKIYAGYDIIICRPDQSRLLGKYFAYLALTDAWRSQLRAYTTGVKVFHVTQALLKRTYALLPPFEEQARITDYLDGECAKLDKASDAIEAQLSNLERYRASVIHEAVTRGLDPSAPTKPSGVDWIGDISQGWKVKKLKHLAVLRTGKTPDTSELGRYYDGSIDWFTPGDLSDAPVSSASKKITDQAVIDGGAFVVPKNSVLLVGIGATAGKTGYLEVDAATNQQITALIPKADSCGKYLFYAMRSMRKRMSDLALYSTVPILNNQYVGGCSVPNPPLDEQQAIADYLDARTSAIDAVVATKRKQLDVLKRRRQSLIYEYVTGKRRVGEEG